MAAQRSVGDPASSSCERDTANKSVEEVTNLIRPLTGYVPTSEMGHRLASPPSSMLLPNQVKAAQDDELSFRSALGRKTRPSAPLARSWIERGLQLGALRPVENSILVYRRERGALIASGVLADISLRAYDSGVIRRHETTILNTERKMIRYMRETRVLGNPVVLAQRTHVPTEKLIFAQTQRGADISFTTADGAKNWVWIVDTGESAEFCSSFDTPLYITDGHHRLAAAANLAQHTEADSYLPGGIFDTHNLELHAFARCILDPDLDPDRLIARLEQDHQLTEAPQGRAVPRNPREYGVRVGSRFFVLVLNETPNKYLYQSLNVNRLQNQVLEPVLGIEDPRTDARIAFEADPSSLDPNRCQAWFLPYPESITQVLAIADQGLEMPPKSTLFLPKLPSGLVMRYLDES